MHMTLHQFLTMAPSQHACVFVLPPAPSELRSTKAAHMLLPLRLAPYSPAQVFGELRVESCGQQWALPDCDCHTFAAVLCS